MIFHVDKIILPPYILGTSYASKHAMIQKNIGVTNLSIACHFFSITFQTCLTAVMLWQNNLVMLSSVLFLVHENIYFILNNFINTTVLKKSKLQYVKINSLVPRFDGI